MTMIDYSQGDSMAILGDELTAIGLGSLTAQAWEQWNKLPDGPFKQAEFVAWLRGTPEYQKRWPYAAAKRARGEYFEEGAAIQFERQVRQIFHMAGVPEGFLTQDYINGLIDRDISFNEVQEDVLGAVVDYLGAPEIVKQEIRAQLGGDDNAAIAFIIDPDHAAQRYQQIIAGAKVRGYGKQYGFGDLNMEQAGEYAYGMTGKEIQGRLAQADQFGALGRGTLGDQGTYGGDELVKDVFTQRTARVERELEERAAQFADAGGGYSAGSKTGFGSARGA